MRVLYLDINEVAQLRDQNIHDQQLYVFAPAPALTMANHHPLKLLSSGDNLKGGGYKFRMTRRCMFKLNGRMLCRELGNPF
jgi:hypothetical protein